jgi:ADP-heptose:LPS heptosyltransferase
MSAHVRGEMPEVVSLLRQPRSILLPRFDTLGDIVLLEGFVEALLSRFAPAKITLLVRRTYSDLRSLFPDALEWEFTDVDPHHQPVDVSLCNQLEGVVGSNIWDLVLTTAHNPTWADDLIAAKQAGSLTIGLGHWMGMPRAQQRVFEQVGLSVDCPYGELIPVPEKSHEIEKYQALWNALGGDSTLPEPKLKVSEHHKAAAEKMLTSAGLSPKNFCLCFPAGTQGVSVQTWPADRFAEVIAWLEAERGVPSLVAGHPSEAARIDEVVELAKEKQATPHKWLGSDGKIPLLAALAGAARFYLGNDTGAMHIAAAVRTPVVAIFGGGTWPRFIPRGRSFVAIAGDMPCFGCGWDCIFEDAPCMRLASIEDVTRAVGSILRDTELERTGARFLPASTKLSAETKRYIEKALDYRSKLAKEIATTNKDCADRLNLIENLEGRLREVEADKAARLETTQRLSRELLEVEADREARLNTIKTLSDQMATIEADRALRLELIEKLTKELKEVEADRALRLELIDKISKELAVVEADRAAQLRVIEDLDGKLSAMQGELAQTRQELGQTQRKLQRIEASLPVRILTKFHVVPS